MLIAPLYHRFVKFKKEGPWNQPKCDKNSGKCSDYFHMQEQTPG